MISQAAARSVHIFHRYQNMFETGRPAQAFSHIHTQKPFMAVHVFATAPDNIKHEQLHVCPKISTLNSAVRRSSLEAQYNNELAMILSLIRIFDN